ncbi:MAG: polysaccharide deacetylase family protein, partial [Phycisphaerales bacterium]|nr:polysaccharide deacetylase family protein [Phycisphaerales bacterium]
FAEPQVRRLGGVGFLGGWMGDLPMMGRSAVCLEGSGVMGLVSRCTAWCPAFGVAISTVPGARGDVDVVVTAGISLMAAAGWLAFFGAGVVALFVVSILGGDVIARWHRHRLRARARGFLVLTYDDGPGERVEPALLARLDRHGAAGTFFLLADSAQRMPDRCDAIAAAGHEIGGHGASHVRARSLRPWRAVMDIRRGYEKLSRWLPEDGLFRPPHGQLTLWTWLALRRRGASYILWTHDGGDTWRDARPDVDAVVRDVIASDGGVILMHSFDGTPGEETMHREQHTLALTDALLNAARQHGWTVCTARAFLERTAATPAATETVAAAGVSSARG